MEKQEKQTFILKAITTTGTKRQLKRRTTSGIISAIFNSNWIADGIVQTKDGKEKLEGQSIKDLKALGVEKIKIPGRKDLAVSIV